MRDCRGFAAGFRPSLLLAVVSFVDEEGVVVVAFSFVDFEIFAAAAVPLGRAFAELEAEDIFEATILISCED